MSFWKTRLQPLAWLSLFAVLAVSCSSSRPAVLKEQLSFDAQGRVVRKARPDGSHLNFAYNFQGLPAAVKYADGAISYRYRPDGLLSGFTDPTGSTEYFYDPFDRLTGVWWQHGQSRLIALRYDGLGRPLRLSLIHGGALLKDPTLAKELEQIKGAGQGEARKRETAWCRLLEKIAAHPPEPPPSWLEYEVGYSYDLAGRLKALNTPAGRVTYSYDGNTNSVVRRLPNGVKSLYTYTSGGKLTQLRHQRDNSELIVLYQYSYQAGGKVSRVVEKSPTGERTTEYLWDERGYLKELKLPDGNSQRFSYDALGNRIRQEDRTGIQDLAYDGFGRLVLAGPTGYKWDANGNAIFRLQGKDKTWIKYDGRGLPQSSKTPKGAVIYGWDGLGQLVSMKQDNKNLSLLSHPLAADDVTLAEYASHGAPSTFYLYGDVLLGRYRQGEMEFFLEDGFNSIRQVVGGRGELLWQRDFTPFGEPSSASHLDHVPFRRRGERYLPELGLYTFEGRLYDPRCGRFVSGSPAAVDAARLDGLNRYGHACEAPNAFRQPRCNQFHKSTEPLARLGFLAALSKGSFFGTRYGSEAAQYWAQQQLKTGNPWYAVPGVISSLWTPETWLETALTLTPSLLMKAGGKAAVFINTLTGGRRGEFVHISLGPYAHFGISSRGPHLGFGTGRNALVHLYPDRVYVGTDSRTGQNISFHWHVLLAGLYSRLKHLGQPEPAPGAAPDRGSPPWLAAGLSQDDVKKFYRAPTWPQDGGGPGGSGHPSWRTDPFERMQAKLGGIRLAAGAELGGNLGNIVGAFYDAEGQRLVMVGESTVTGPMVRHDDLAVALALVSSGSQEAQFSLDPADPRNPRGDWFRAVYWPERLLPGTEFGRALFEADYLLKQYSFGVTLDAGGRLRERHSRVPGFRSEPDLILANPGHPTGQATWCRMWIESETMVLREKRHVLFFEQAKMRVKAKKQVPDSTSRTGLRDVEVDDPVSRQFAQLFTNLYDDIARESPEFERVRQLAKAVALAKWLKREGIPYDRDWVNEQLSKRSQYVTQAPALRWQKSRITGNAIHTVYLFGGVDLTVRPSYQGDNGKAADLEQGVRAGLKDQKDKPIFTVDQGGKKLTAVILPLTKPGQALWKENPSCQVEGVTYLFDQTGRVIQSIDQAGGATHFDYDAKGSLKKVVIAHDQGWETVGERTEEGSAWVIKNPAGRRAQLTYDAAGKVTGLSIDGTPLAQFSVNVKDKSLTSDLGTHQITAWFGEDEGLVKCEVKDKAEPAAGGRLSLEYGKKGLLERWSGPGLPAVTAAYDAAGNLAKLSLPGEQIRYIYQADGRLKELSTDNGLKADFSYSGEQVSALRVSGPEGQADLQFGPAGLQRRKDFEGEVTEFEYTNDNLAVVKSPGYGESHYAFDENKRLKSLVFPGGARLEYQYGGGKPSKKRKGSQEDALLTMTSLAYPAPAAASPVGATPQPSRRRLAARRAEPDSATDMKGWPEVYRDFLAAPDVMAFDKKVAGRDVGTDKIIRCYEPSFTQARLFLVRDAQGRRSVVKIEPYQEEVYRRSVANLQVLDELQGIGANWGFEVAEALPVAGSRKVVVINDLIITRFREAPGETLDKLPYSQAMAAQFSRTMINLFVGGRKVKAAEKLRPPIFTSQDMLQAFTASVGLGRLAHPIFRFQSRYKQAAPEGRKAAAAYHDAMLKLGRTAFSWKGRFRHTGYNHDNTMRNYVADSPQGRITAIDTADDFQGPLGTSLVAGIRDLGLKRQEAGQALSYQDFEAWLTQTLAYYLQVKDKGQAVPPGSGAGDFWTDGKAVPVDLSPEDLLEISCCMIRPIYHYSSADSRAILRRLLSEFGIPEGKEAADNLQAKMQSDPAAVARLDQIVEGEKARYHLNLDILHFTCQYARSIIQRLLGDPGQLNSLKRYSERGLRQLNQQFQEMMDIIDAIKKHDLRTRQEDPGRMADGRWFTG